MRIALLHYSAPPVIGGVEKIVAAHAGLLRGKGHEVRIVAQRGAPDILLQPGPSASELQSALADTDIVVAHNILTMPFDMKLTSALWQLAEKCPDQRWIAWIHDIAACNPHYDRDWNTAPWDRLTRATPHFEHVAISALRARQFLELTGRAARVIPNAIDPHASLGLTAAVTEFASRHRLITRELVLLHPTRLLKRKRVEFSLEVLAQLRGSGYDAVLLITGANDPHNPDGDEYAAALRSRRKQLGVEASALFVSEQFVPAEPDMASLYALSDALLFPSTQEGFGLPVIEAALSRLPIFCSDVEPLNTLLAEKIHPFDVGASPGDVAQLIRSILANSSAHRARREAIQRYTWEAVWKEHLEPLLRERP